MPRSVPHFGLVCITASQECRYRTITRARFLQLTSEDQREELEKLYWDNLSRMHQTLSFCHRHDIRLYRVTSALFPMSDEPVGDTILDSMSANLSSIGRRVERLGIRVVMHPDQFVVLNSDNPKVVETSKLILAKQAKWFDLMGLPRSPWSALIIHGGKAGRAKELIATIRGLPVNVRSRLCLENDEYAYSASEIHEVCKAAGVPMIFDNLHHAIKEKIQGYDDKSFARCLKLAGDTWPKREWQIVHLSNGASAFLDRNHSQMITAFPLCFTKAPWIEVEARGKEEAIAALRAKY